jgi:hypothetical protein
MKLEKILEIVNKFYIFIIVSIFLIYAAPYMYEIFFSMYSLPGGDITANVFAILLTISVMVGISILAMLLFE